MKINAKMVHKFSKMVEKKFSPREVLRKVLVSPKKMVATNGVVLLEIQHESEVKKPQLLDLHSFKRIFKKVDEDVEFETRDNDTGRPMDSKFPNYEHLVPKRKPKASIKVNVNFLIDLLTQFKGSEEDAICIEIREGMSSPLVITNYKEKTMKGLLMPIID